MDAGPCKRPKAHDQQDDPELGVTTGLRLSEMCTARMGTLRAEEVPGIELAAPATRVWLLTVLGKGNKEREVVIFDDVKELIDAHQRDIASADLQVDPAAPLRSLAAAMPTGPVAEAKLPESTAQVDSRVLLDPELLPIGPHTVPSCSSQMSRVTPY